MIKNDIKTAFRMLTKTGVSGALNIIGLTISLVVVILIGWWIQNETRYDNYHPRVAHKYVVKNTNLYDNGNSRAEINTPHNAVTHLQTEYPEIEDVAYCFRGYKELKISIANQLFSDESRLYISRNWFDFFHHDIIQLDTAAFNSQPNSVILTENRARRYFGHTEVVGEILKIDSANYTVHGVIKDNPSHSSLDFDVLLPFDDQKQLREANQWMYFNTIVFVETTSAANIPHLQQQIDQVFSKNIQWTQDGIHNRTELLPLTDLHFDESLPQAPFRPGSYQHVLIFGMLAVFLLVAAIINYVNFILAQAFSRVKELGIRRVVGANRKQLIQQILMESAVSCTIALGAAIPIAYLAVPYCNAYFSLKLTVDFGALHIHLLLISLWVVLVLLSGVYPALHLSALRAIHLFKGLGSLGFGGKKIRKSLLVIQLAVTVVMIFAVLTMYRQMKHIQSKSDAFDHAQTLMIGIPPIPTKPNTDIKADVQHSAIIKKTLKDQLLQSPHINRVSTTVNPSVIDEQYLMAGNLDWNSKPPAFQAQYGNWPVDDDFDKAMNLEIVTGRWFQGGDSTDQHSFVLNETAISQFNIPEPVIGTRINNNGREGAIIGVVRDFHFQNLRETIRPMVLYKRNNWGDHFIIATHSGSAYDALQDAEKLMKARFPNEIFTFRFLDEEFNMMYRKDLQTMTIVSAVSVVSVCLSVVGLLGMVIFECRQRTKEIGVRKVLGATVANIVMLLSSDFVKLVLIAATIAFPIGCWLMHRWLGDFAYRVDLQWWMFASAGLGALTMALLTVSWQAIRAAGANPVESLRDE